MKPTSPLEPSYKQAWMQSHLGFIFLNFGRISWISWLTGWYYIGGIHNILAILDLQMVTPSILMVMCWTPDIPMQTHNCLTSSPCECWGALRSPLALAGNVTLTFSLSFSLIHSCHFICFLNVKAHSLTPTFSYFYSHFVIKCLKS